MELAAVVRAFPVGTLARVKSSGREFIVQGHVAVHRNDPWIVETVGEYWSVGQIESVQ